MTTDVDRLAVLIEANTKSYERAMTRMEAKTDKALRAARGDVRKLDASMKAAARSSTALSTRMGALSTAAGKRLVSPITAAAAGALSLTAAFTKARAAISALDATAKKSRDVGLSPELFQALGFAATEASIDQGRLNTALERFARAVGEAKAGQGSLFTTLQRTNPELLKQITGARTVEQALRTYADAIEVTSSASDRAALAAAGFGRAGVEMTRIFADGADGLDDYMRRAEELGLVISRDLLVRAEELETQMGVLGQAIDTELNAALVELGPVITFLLREIRIFIQDVKGAVDEVRDLAKALGLLEDAARTMERNKRAAANLEKQIAAIRDRVEEGQRALDQGIISTYAINHDIAKLRRLEQALIRVRGINRQDDLQLFRNADAQSMQSLRNSQTFDVDIPDPDKPPVIPPVRGSRGSGGASRRATERDRAAEAAERERERVVALIADLEHEHELIGMSAQEQAVMNALRRAGSAATDEQRARIEELVTATAALRDEQTDAAEAQQFLAQTAYDALEGVILGTDNAKDAMLRLSSAIAQAVLQATLLGKGPLSGLLGDTGGGGGLLGGLFGTFFGGGKRSGGPVIPGRAYRTGEEGEELFVPTVPGEIIPNGALERMAAQNAPSEPPITVSMTVVAQDAPSFRRSEGQILADMNRGIARGRRHL